MHDGPHVYVELPGGYIAQPVHGDGCRTVRFLLDTLEASNVRPAETTWSVGPCRKS